MSETVRRSALLLLFGAWAVGLVGLPSAVADTDVGNIAVIETDPTILQPGELFDLNNRSLTFTPRSGGGYTVSSATLNFDANTGTNLNLGDDVSVQRGLAFTFPFFGVNRTSVFINSNGNLTFGSGSTFPHFNSGSVTSSSGSVTSLGSDLSAVLDTIADQARIAVLWQDWNPAAGGGVFVNSLSDRLIVTWSGVPLFNTATTATFQVILFNTGVIRMNYQSVTTTPGGGYLVGLSPGASDRFQTTTIDFSRGGSSISSFPTFEPLVQVFGSSSSPLVHIPAVARLFFNTHTDAFDQFVMFANFTHAMGDAFAFERTTRQTVSGINRSLFDISSFFGSSGRLQSFLNMNRLQLYPADPSTTFLGSNNTLDLMGQESGHHWLAFVNFDDSGVCSTLLLGRDLSHWSFFHDTDASDMEGNKWRDNGNGTFATIDATSRFSALDQYIMGLRTTASVPPFFFIRNPTNTGGRTAVSAPENGVTVSGTRQNVTVNQIQACHGPRSPSSGFTAVNPTTTWKQAFILLIPGGTTASSADITKIDTIRSGWQSYFATATGGRGSVDTSLPTNVDVRTYVPAAAAPTGYVSFLRIINTGSVATPVSVAVINGTTGVVGPSGQLIASLPAGGALTFTAQQVEVALGTTLPAGERPRIRVSGTSLETQSFLLQPGGVFNEVSGALGGASSATVRTYVPAAAAPTGYVSYLRVINTGTAATPVTVAKVDPATGLTGPAGTLNASLPAGAALTYTAAQVEAALGSSIAAAERPRILVSATNTTLQVQSFLLQPGGAFTEVSTGQAGTTVDVRSYVPASAGGYTSYIRVISNSATATPVTVTLLDDVTGLAGATGTLIASLPGFAAMTFSSAQVEAALRMTIPVASRPRLRISAATDLRVQSFLLQPGGAFSEISNAASGTSVMVRSYAPAAAAGSGYTSYLRVINTGATATPITLTLVDGATGALGAAGTITASLPAGAARTFSSSQIEAALGIAIPAGTRPRIRVAGDGLATLEVQSFLLQPGGAFLEMSGGQTGP